MTPHSPNLNEIAPAARASSTRDSQSAGSFAHAAGIHIAYIMWHFPLLSETFIQREILALRARGVRITVIADAIVDTSLLGEAARRLTSDAVAILPLDADRVADARRVFVRQHPWRFFSSRLFLATRRYHQQNNREFDREVFNKAVYIAALCRDIGISHIHSPWTDLNAVTGMIAADLLGLSFSVQARAHDIHRHSYRHGLEHVFRRADLVVTNTGYNVAHLERTYPGVATKLRRIYNGLPLEAFEYRAPRSITGRPLEMLCVARLIEQKGVDDLLRVCSRLRSRGIEVRAIVLGGPEADYESVYERLLLLRQQLTLEEIVEFAGDTSHDDVVSAYRRADIFMLPSRLASDGSRDIIPNAILEAMACGVPVISTRVTGIPEIIDDGVNGLLRDPCDVEGLVDAVVELLADEALRQYLSRNAREKIEAQFDIDRNVLEYERAYCDIHRARIDSTSTQPDHGHLS